jgi:Zn-dependent peptidase ImmA (M78 family)
MKKYINPSRLKLARNRRQFTIKALAEETNLTTKMVSKYENDGCEHTPKDGTLAAFSRALGYPEEFFLSTDIIETLSTESVSFRSLKSMRAYQEHAAIAAGQLGILLNSYLTSKFPKLPKVNLLDLRSIEPEAAANALRDFWNLGQQSISNMIHLLEKNGVRVFSLAENTQSVDAFSFWKDDVPYIFLNTQKSGERSRFDAAHELGHLVLHRHGTPQGRDIEAEADKFSANFLMPKLTILPYKSPHISIQNILEFKKNWKVSAMALIVQMKNSGAISEWQHRNLIIEASGLGLRKKEINGIESEKSGLLQHLLNHLQKEENIGMLQIAAKLKLPLEEITNLMFKMALVTGGTPVKSGSSKPNLRIV